MEGSTLDKDKIALIDGGVIKYGYTDKKASKENNIINTAGAIGDYDGMPEIEISFLGESRFRPKAGNKTLKEILEGREAIYVAAMSRGDCTSEGDFASPVQMAYLFKDGKIIGRLPQFSVYGNIYDMFGEDYLGESLDKAYFGDNAMVINMNIK